MSFKILHQINDSSQLSEEEKEILNRKMEWLKTNISLDELYDFTNVIIDMAFKVSSALFKNINSDFFTNELIKDKKLFETILELTAIFIDRGDL